MKRLPWSDAEIIQSWNNCDDPSEHVSVLAQLNGCRPRRIKDILRSAQIKSFMDLYCDDSGNYIEIPKHSTYYRWSALDDDLLIECRERYGQNWKQIGQRFGVSDVACKTRYYNLTREQRKQEVII
ncbi:MAG: SANT/Myb-like DNA-binding domain-containing protein [Christensenellales bacterium]